MARSIHNQLASVSIIPLPNAKQLATITAKVIQQNLLNRLEQWSLKPRKEVKAIPIPERVGEPSVFKHVVISLRKTRHMIRFLAICLKEMVIVHYVFLVIM